MLCRGISSRSFPCSRRFSTVELIRVAAGVVLGCVASTAATAQGQQGRRTLNPMTMGVRITKKSILVDPKAHTASIEFINSSDDTLHADLTVQDSIPGMDEESADPSSPDFDAQVAAMQRALRRATDQSDGTKGGHGKPTSGATRKSSPKDSVVEPVTLAAWVQDLPKQVTLAPHAKQTVTLHLAVPPHLSPGTYSAYVTATTQSSDTTGQVSMWNIGGGGADTSGADTSTAVGVTVSPNGGVQMGGIIMPPATDEHLMQVTITADSTGTHWSVSRATQLVYRVP